MAHKYQGTARAATDPGDVLLAVRQDAAADLAGADGDYTPLQVDASGALRVAGGGTGGTASADGDTFTAGTTSFTPVGGYRDDTAPGTVTEGDAAAARLTEYRALHVNLRDASGAELAVGGGTQYDEDAAHVSGSKVTGCGIVRKDTAASLAGTDGDYALPIADASGKLWVNAEVTVALPAGTNNIGDVDIASVVPGVAATSLGKAEDAAHASGDTGVAALAVRRDTAASGTGADGDYATFNVNASGRLYTSTTVDAALPAGTNAIGKLAANSGVDIGDVDITSIAAGETHIGQVGGHTPTFITSFTRPANATAYAANDAVSDSTTVPTILTFTNVVRVAGQGGYLTRLRLTTDQSTNVASFRVHFFHTAPTPVADNAPQTLLWANRDKRVGSVALAVMATMGAGSDAAESQDVSVRLQFTCAAADRNLYALVETLTAFTPASAQNFRVEAGFEVN